jgi:NitT/TauT family transport system substrate-binding protein
MFAQPISVTIYLDWVLCAQFAGLCWAVDKGLYAAAGLDVTLIPWHNDGHNDGHNHGHNDGHNDGSSVIEKVLHTSAAGQLCVGSLEDNLVVRSVAHGSSVRAFGSMLQDTPMVLMSHPSKSIRTLADLRGKRIGMHTDGIRALEVILALEGILTSEVDIREVGFDLNHLRHGHVDALQGYVMTEPIELAELGESVDVLSLKHARLQPYAQTYFAEHSMLVAHQATYAAFREASTAGWVAVCNEPEAAAVLVSQMMNQPTQVATQLAMLEQLIPLVSSRFPTDRVGTVNTAQWERNLETYFDFGIVDHRLALHDVVFDLGSGSAQQPV